MDMGERGYIAILVSIVISYTVMHISIHQYREEKHEDFMEKKEEVSKINNELSIANNDLAEARTRYQLLLERSHNILSDNPNDSIEIVKSLQDAKIDLEFKIHRQYKLQEMVDSIRQTSK